MRGNFDDTGISRAEWISDAVVHVTGLVVVTACVPVLIVLTAMFDKGALPVAGAAIYGGTFAAMITFSAIYNLLYGSRIDWLLKRLDHSAIYLKIAGTFTAFALFAGQGAHLLAVLWTAAATGVALKLWCPHRFRIFSIALYLGMGWIGALAGWGIFAALPGATVLLIAVAGVTYTAGVVFYLWEKLPYHTAIWHVFVLAASLMIYSGMVVAAVG